MSAVRKPSPTTLLTMAALVLAAGIRLWKLGWGLSLDMYFPDEQQIWPSYLFAFVPLEWESFLRPERYSAFIYPTFFGNLAGLTVAAVNSLGLLAAPPWKDFSSALYYARLVAAMASVVTVGLVAVAGRRLYTPWTGVIAAFFMALVPLEAIQAHYANVDCLLVALMSASMLLAWKVARTASIGWAVAAGLCTGFAFGTKYTGLAVGAVVAWGGIEAAWSARSIRPLVVIGLSSLGGLAVGFSLACPACLVQSEHWLDAMTRLSSVSNLESLLFWKVELVPALGWTGRPLAWQLFAALPFALGWPLYLVAMCGLVMSLWRRTLSDRILLVLMAASFFPMATSIVDAPRYVLPLGPPLAILGARFLLSLPGRATAAVITCAVCLYSFTLTASQVSRLNYDQQNAVADWIRTSVPARADGQRLRVGLPAHHGEYYGLRRPIAYAGMESLLLWSDEWRTADIDAFVLPDTHVVFVHRSAPGSPDERIVDLMQAGESGFREAARFEQSYFDQDVYIGIDPSFAGDLLLGETGFRVYVRDGR